MISNSEILQQQLDDLDSARRQDALRCLVAGAGSLPEPGPSVNVHCHTFFSYNGYGYSPSSLAWRARKAGLLVAGVVDFDVLDAVDEFLDACRLVGLRGCAGVETRVFVEEFAGLELNSPGEPGIAYAVGAGFVPGAGSDDPLLAEMREVARERTRAIAERVNSYLAPANVDFERDVAALTPKGNATERHLCIAYDLKAREVFVNDDERAGFWSDKLGRPAEKMTAILNDAPALQAMIRAKTMKKGGVGYVQASGSEFPRLETFNGFILNAGAIPSYAFLDGASAGESNYEGLLDVMTAKGAASVTIIPDRNWNIKDPRVKKLKVDNLYRFVEMVQSLDMPIFVGTEMNAHGQRFVDAFDTPELSPLLPVFQEGALLQYGHTVMQQKAGMGYLSEWARKSFRSVKEKNAFYVGVGRKFEPKKVDSLRCAADMSPGEIIVV